MKRFHIHTHVQDLQASIAFYSKLFGALPARVETDYAKWMLEDPRINFAISTRGDKPGIDHLGFQTDTQEELAELKERAEAAEMTLLDEGPTTCCYARSDKHWVVDPQGMAWEHFHTLGTIAVFREGDASNAAACCTPGASLETAASAVCCTPTAPAPTPNASTMSAASSSSCTQPAQPSSLRCC